MPLLGVVLSIRLVRAGQHAACGLQACSQSALYLSSDPDVVGARVISWAGVVVCCTATERVWQFRMHLGITVGHIGTLQLLLPLTGVNGGVPAGLRVQLS